MNKIYSCVNFDFNHEIVVEIKKLWDFLSQKGNGAFSPFLLGTFLTWKGGTKISSVTELITAVDAYNATAAVKLYILPSEKTKDFRKVLCFFTKDLGKFEIVDDSTISNKKRKITSKGFYKSLASLIEKYEGLKDDGFKAVRTILINRNNADIIRRYSELASK